MLQEFSAMHVLADARHCRAASRALPQWQGHYKKRALLASWALAAKIPLARNAITTIAAFMMLSVSGAIRAHWDARIAPRSQQALRRYQSLMVHSRQSFPLSDRNDDAGSERHTPDHEDGLTHTEKISNHA
jgi:hypothetical protein